MTQDKDLLKALGFPDDMIQKFQHWADFIEEYKTDNPDIEVNKYFIININQKIISFNDDTPPKLRLDLDQKYRQIFWGEPM